LNTIATDEMAGFCGEASPWDEEEVRHLAETLAARLGPLLRAAVDSGVEVGVEVATVEAGEGWGPRPCPVVVASHPDRSDYRVGIRVERSDRDEIAAPRMLKLMIRFCSRAWKRNP